MNTIFALLLVCLAPDDKNFTTTVGIHKRFDGRLTLRVYPDGGGLNYRIESGQGGGGPVKPDLKKGWFIYAEIEDEVWIYDGGQALIFRPMHGRRKGFPNTGVYQLNANKQKSIIPNPVLDRLPDSMKKDEKAARDEAVLETLFEDLRAGGGRILFNKKQVLFSLEAPEWPPNLAVSDVIHERQLREDWKPSPEQLARAREAILEVVGHQKNKTPFKGYKPRDERIIIWDKPSDAPDPAQPGLLAAQVFRVFEPGYSKDEQLAVIYLTCPADIHVRFGSYVLVKKEGRWVVVFRDVWSTS